MQSTILDYAPTLAGNDLYYMGMLPVYAATANYFGKAGAGVDQLAWFDRAWKFVDEKYGRALIASDSIKGYAETVRDLTGDDKKHRDEQMNIIVDETDRLTALVSSVMELSKVTSGALKCEKVHFDMGQLCDEVSERYDAVCAQNGWQLKLEIPDEELPDRKSVV